jgi:hypothetical protein
MAAHKIEETDVTKSKNVREGASQKYSTNKSGDYNTKKEIEIK